MAREPKIRGDEDEFDADEHSDGIPNDENRFDDELRPQRLEDIVGQAAVVERLKIILDAAKLRGDPLGHLLLSGPPGLGKTTIATLFRFKV